jgi:methyl-accepting chemotaxis protein
MNGTWTFTRKIGLLVAFALAVLLAVGALALWSSRGLLDAHHRVDAAHATVEALDDLVDATHVAEYRCTLNLQLGTAASAEAARRAIDAVPATEGALDAFRGDPQLARDAEELRTQLTEELRQLGRQLDARRESAEAAAKLNEDRNVELEAVERIEASLEAAVRERLGRDSATAAEEAAATERTLIAGSLAALVLLVVGGVALARGLARQVGGAVGEMKSASTELNAAANQQAAGSREQATATTEVTTTIRELLASARQIAESAQRVARIADDTAKAANAGRATVGQAQEAIGSIRRQVDLIVGHMVELGRTSQRIGSILEIIGELAEQTNILAINATIESAGAGEAGRRFAVVAEEIRKLADRVGGSAKEIRPLIEEIRSAANAAVMATEDGSKAVDAGAKRFGEVAASFAGIADAVAVTSDAAREIELSTKQQSTAVEQVNQAIGSVAVAAKQMEASTTQTFQASSRLAELARDLSRLVTAAA